MHRAKRRHCFRFMDWFFSKEKDPAGRKRDVVCMTRPFMVACDGVFVASADTADEARAYCTFASSVSVDVVFGLDWRWCSRAEWLEAQRLEAAK